MLKQTKFNLKQKYIYNIYAQLLLKLNFLNLGYIKKNV